MQNSKLQDFQVIQGGNCPTRSRGLRERTEYGPKHRNLGTNAALPASPHVILQPITSPMPICVLIHFIQFSIGLHSNVPADGRLAIHLDLILVGEWIDGNGKLDCYCGCRNNALCPNTSSVYNSTNWLAQHPLDVSP